MKFVVDAQLPPGLACFIKARGHNASPVREVGLRDAEDDDIWAFAKQGDWVVVTKDEDFADWALRDTTGPRVVWLRIGNCTNRALLAWLEPVFSDVVRELENGSRIVEVRHGS